MLPKFLEKYLTDMERTSCPVCERDNYVVIARQSRGELPLRTALCNFCGHLYLNSRPSLRAYNRLFQSDDFRRFIHTTAALEGRRKAVPGEGERLRKGYPVPFDDRVEMGKRLYRHYLHGLVHKGDRIFDFGCGEGGMLYGIRELVDCEAFGFDPSASNVRIGASRGLSVFQGTTEDLAEELVAKFEGQIKLVFISGSLRSMVDILKAVRTAHRILQDGGYLWINDKDILRQAEKLKMRLHDLVTIWPQNFHELPFKFLLERSGFEILSFDPDPKVRPSETKYKVRMEVFARKASVPVDPIPDYDCGLIRKRIRRAENAARQFAAWLKIKAAVETVIGRTGYAVLRQVPPFSTVAEKLRLKP